MSVLVMRIGPDELDAGSDWLWQLGATAIEERGGLEFVTLVAGFTSDDAALAARSVLSERWPCRLESTGEEQAWRDEWLRWIEPISVGPFVVHAPWHDPAGWADWDETLELSIDPGRAFGSGHHPTTRLCLQQLGEVDVSGARVLDVGCGTGILSIAAAKLGAATVLGLDIDRDVIDVAEINSEANRTDAITEFATGRVQNHENSFDIVVCNIVIGSLRPLLPHLLRICDGSLIVSGFLIEQADEIRELLDAPKATLTQLDDWACILIG